MAPPLPAPRGADPRPALTAALLVDRWGPEHQAWAAAWRRAGDAQLLVIDRSAEGLADLPGGLEPISAPAARAGAAAQLALRRARGAWLLVQEHPAAPPTGLPAAPVEPAPLLLGSTDPPSGEARSALDALMLHLLPVDALARAPAVWPAVPEGIVALLPTGPLLSLGGFDADEPHLGLAVQLACLALAARDVPVQLDPQLRGPVPRRSLPALAAAVRGAAAARVSRLARDPDTPLEPGWSLATRAAVRELLERPGAPREAAAAAVAAVDVRPLAALPEWVPVARDLLRRLLLELKALAQRWPLEGIELGLQAAGVDSIPELLARHPIRVGRRPSVLIPVERPDPNALRRCLRALLGPGGPPAPQLAVVSGPATGVTLRDALSRDWAALRLMAALRGGELFLHPMPLSAARAARLLKGAVAWVPDPRLQGEAWAHHAASVGAVALPAPPGPAAGAPRTDAPGPDGRPLRLLAFAPSVADGPALRAFVDEVLGPLSQSGALSVGCIAERGDPPGALAAALRPVLRAGLPLEVRALEPTLDELPALGLAHHALVGPASDTRAPALGLPQAPAAAALLDLWVQLNGSGLGRDPVSPARGSRPSR
jgi:hypothetical protein